MPVIEKGAFQRGVAATRRGFDRAGLAASLGQDPAYRRMMEPFGGNALAAPAGRNEDFTRSASRGLYASPVVTSDGFSAQRGGIPAFEWGSYGIQYDQNGRRISAGTPAAPSADGSWTGTGTGAGTAGGKWAALDPYNAAINAAAQRYGVDPNRLKAHMMIESGGNPQAVQNNPYNGNTYGLMQINPNIWSSVLAAQGIDMFTPEGNIMGAAYILSDLNKKFGSWDAASSAYFTGGPGWQGADTVNGTTGAQYKATLDGYMQELSAYGGGSWASSGGATASSNTVVNTALSFVGKVPYVWGGIPGKGQQPTGWDCSGFTYWLDQNYGSGNLPMGSHYQFQYAQQTNQLSTNPQSLAPGDLVFFDTGDRSGGGANLNGASHVAMYIGNGQMVHAANPSVGTITSNISDYMNQYGYLGSMHMSWSGGSGAAVPTAPTGTNWAAPAYTPPPRLRR